MSFFNKLIIVVVTLLLTMVHVMFADVMEVAVPDRELLIENQGPSAVLEMQNFGMMNIPGQPRLPSRIFAVAVPCGAVVDDVVIYSGQVERVPGSFDIQPASMRLPLMTLTDEEMAVYETRYQEGYREVYSRDALWPEKIGWMEREAGFRKYQLVDIRINPVQYNPVTGELFHHHGIRIEISYTIPVRQPVIQDGIPAMETTARRLIVNYDMAQDWYPVERDAGQRSQYPQVIITTAALVSSVQPIVDFESNVKGRSVYVATVEEIDASVAGVDLAQKMRNFLRERYPASSWGIEDVLLVGHHNDVPMRMVAQDLDYGEPRTDFYFAELSNPDSINWDSNNNGEYWDNQDSADFYAEINVGRIPWSTPATVAAICQRSVDFELNDNEDYKKNILLLGSFFWENTDNAVLMEYIMDQPHMADWSSVRMYEQNSTVYSTYPCDYELIRANVQAVWPTGQFAFVDMAGHGSYQSVHIMGYNSASFWTSTLCSSLSNEFPSIVFSDACSTSETDYTNLGQKMLENGAVGYVGATKVALGSGGWTTPADGSSQTLDYYFTEAVTSTNYSQGAAHQYALSETYQTNGFYYDKYEIAEWNLWGHPNLGLTLAMSGNGSIKLDKAIYMANDTAVIALRDANAGTVDSISVEMTGSGGDKETVTLTMSETEGVYAGSIALVESQAVVGNNRLDVSHGQTITVTYIDADDGMGGINVEKTEIAMVDGNDPVITNVRFGRISSELIEVLWDTSEPATAVLRYGIETLNESAESAIPVTDHSVILSDLEPCTYYFFTIEATDEAGNSVMDDNSGQYYRVNTLDYQIFYSESLNSDPGWSTENLWSFGSPTGQGGEHGYPDPVGGYTGSNVYGFNLNGDYNHNSPAYNLTSDPIDCSDSTNIILRFWRWLGVERNLYDKASIMVSSDGVNFTKIWENLDIETADDEWTLQEFDISEIADGQPTVYLRWVMGATDQGWKYCGWNIDDITLSRTVACSEPTPPPWPTATPAPPKIPSTGIYLTMADSILVPGDTFDLKMCLRNGTALPMTVNVFVALEVYGTYWFWPTWVKMDEGIDYAAGVGVPAASEIQQDILHFEWPDVSGPAQGLFFYGLLLDSSTLEVTGDLAWICWEFI
ncbi:hypothetical protein JW823_09225 [bacterium]|nr:hypothetical protein [candidate division CSSED10-310 bacterium]